MRLDTKEAVLEDKGFSKDVVLNQLQEEFDISQELAEACIWDYLCTEEGWDNIVEDLENNFHLERQE